MWLPGVNADVAAVGHDHNFVRHNIKGPKGGTRGPRTVLAYERNGLTTMAFRRPEESMPQVFAISHLRRGRNGVGGVLRPGT